MQYRHKNVDIHELQQRDAASVERVTQPTKLNLKGANNRKNINAINEVSQSNARSQEPPQNRGGNSKTQIKNKV